ncbi:MAG: DUF3990 domain-containing protein [Eubacteriales bacterium]|nr:DUF3990 domain-containing protein [Eubacteriales bacterium]
MTFKLYHGSEKIIERPQFGLGSIANDYGRGFYLTESPELAGEWACKNNCDGFINAYELDTKGLKICDLNSGDYNILNWLAVLTKYRGYWQKRSIAEEAKDYLQKHFTVDLSVFDIVRGYRADDSYFSFAQDFIMGTISLQQLNAAFQLGKLGEQIVLKSQKAFERISYLGHTEADAAMYYSSKLVRDKKARKDYAAYRAAGKRTDEIYIIDILRGRDIEDACL